jgi:hypothetical protein
VGWTGVLDVPRILRPHPVCDHRILENQSFVVRGASSILDYLARHVGFACSLLKHFLALCLSALSDSPSHLDDFPSTILLAKTMSRWGPNSGIPVGFGQLPLQLKSKPLVTSTTSKMVSCSTSHASRLGESCVCPMCTQTIRLYRLV